MAEITVTPIDDATFRVEVREGSGGTTHEVTADAADVERYGAGADAATLVHASFKFLLEREPKEAIMRQFSLPVIERYFGDYPRAIANYL